MWDEERDAPIRGLRTAASLKPRMFAMSDCVDCGYPRPPDRGLIEARPLLKWTLADVCYPRPPDRGLIEAFSSLSDPVTSTAYPRPPDRGLIEAAGA